MVRFKKRYLLVEISFKDGKVDDRILGKVVYDTVKKAVISAHGDYGMACVARSMQVKYINSVTGVAFIACARDYYRMVWSALTFISSITIKDKVLPCIFRVLYVGGTILSCQKFLIRHNKDQLLKLLQNCKTPVERKKVSKTIKKAEKHEISLGSYISRQRKTIENTRINFDIPLDEEDFDSAERKKVAKTVKKAEKPEISLGSFITRQRKTIIENTGIEFDIPLFGSSLRIENQRQAILRLACKRVNHSSCKLNENKIVRKA